VNGVARVLSRLKEEFRLSQPGIATLRSSCLALAFGLAVFSAAAATPKRGCMFPPPPEFGSVESKLDPNLLPDGYSCGQFGNRKPELAAVICSALGLRAAGMYKMDAVAFK
jgi:hypothetical protein